MIDLLTWVYLVNSIILINHEIDWAYWKEWELFKLPGGINGFLVLHIPLLFVVLFGLIKVHQKTMIGFTISLILALSGVFAFIIHTYFIKKGRKEFNTKMSLSILWAALAVSIIQAAMSIQQIIKYGAT